MIERIHISAPEEEKYTWMEKAVKELSPKEKRTLNMFFDKKVHILMMEDNVTYGAITGRVNTILKHLRENIDIT